MHAQDDHPENAAAPVEEPGEITLCMYLPERGWLTIICIPRAKLVELCLNPVKWLRYIAFNVYGADGDIFSKVNSDDDADEDATMTDVGSDEQEEPPLKEEPPVDETTILSPATPLEEIPVICYFWSKYAPPVSDLQMISDRKSTKPTLDPGSLSRNSRLLRSVKERDGDDCVFNASLGRQTAPLLVQACHFVPHSKGDEYIERLERFHEVPLEDQMHVVDTPLNIISMKVTCHMLVTRAVAAILPVPNRFLSKEDIKFTAKPRFKGDIQLNSLHRAEGSHEDDQSEPSPTNPSFGSGDEEYRPPLSSSEQQHNPARAHSARLRQAQKNAIAEAEREEKEEKAALEKAAHALAHLTSGQGYAKFQKPKEEPFNDDSQLVLQYLVGGVDEWETGGVPHNTPALLREGTRLSVAALHAAYTCAVWKTFSPSTTDSTLAPHIPRYDHYGLQRTRHKSSRPTGGEGSSSRTAPAPTSTSTPHLHSHSHSHTFAGQQRQLDERSWDLLLGWSIPSVAARPKAAIRRARPIEQE
ncbi:hypothetical protein B0H12DRAFT_1229953 [Mycena haematopus]|nr:hypothetical protein B0H12DRAFT_1229953 [Mycena haematopus]